MTHLFKVQLQHSDLFVSNLNVEKSTISYEARDKETGLLIEPPSINDPFTVLGDRISFSKRFIPLGIVNKINETLN